MSLRNVISKNYITISFALLCASSFVNATQSTEESKALLNNLKQQISTTVAAIVDSEKRAGQNPQDLHIVLDIPEAQSSNLGLVLDLEDKLGLRVLSVTPGSYADTVKIVPNDIITSVNGIDTISNDKRRVFAELENALPGDTLVVDLNKNGVLISISTKIEGQYSPPIKIEIGELALSSVNREMATTDPTSEVDENACSKITVFFTPPSTKRLYNAYITNVDDQNVSNNITSYRLPPGKHTFHVRELIDDRFFNRRSSTSQKPKAIEIDMQENTTYYLAAKYHSKKSLTASNGEFWEPVIWKVRENATCKLN